MKKGGALSQIPPLKHLLRQSPKKSLTKTSICTYLLLFYSLIFRQRYQVRSLL